MVLIKCKECGGDMSSTADRCPHCRAKRSETEGENLIWGLCGCLCLIGIFIIFILML